jgi:SAM-dependent methyltransferase
MSSNPLVLEIGAGAGDDISMLEDLGCRVLPSDGAQAFVDIMASKGYNAFLLDVSKKMIPGTYDVIYANHVFIHMTSEDVQRILPKIYGALRQGGRFIFNVGNRDGDGEHHSGWVDLPGFHELGAKRYFHYWKNYHLIQCVEDAGFVVKNYEVDGGSDDRRWIEICAIKP